MASILDSLDSAPSSTAPRRSGSILDAPDSLSFDIPAPPAESLQDTRSTTDRIFGRYDPIINEAADRYGLDRRLLKSLVSVESSNNPNAVSNKGALGLGQVMPGTAREMGYSPEDMTDPVKNVDASARYLAKMLDMSGGDITTALRKYNAGPYADLNKINNQKYADDVMSRAMRFNESDRSDLARGFEQGIKGFVNDATRGLQGFSNAAEGFDAGQNYLDYLNAQEEIGAGARPQDQLSGAEGWGEILGDTVPTAIGQGLGSSAPALAGAGLGFLAGGPVGAVLGGALPLAAQYLGNTWGESTQQDLLDQRIQNAATAPRDQLEQAASMDAAETLRVGGAGLARAGVELGSDLALGGLGGLFGKGAMKVLPSGMGGAAVDLLSTPLGKTAAGMSTEALTEMADVPLSALGAGRPVSQIPGSEYSDAAFGGAVGGGGMVAGGQAVTNPGGVLAQTRSFVDPNYRKDYQSYATGRRALGGDPVPEAQYNREFYNDRFLRERTRNASDYVREGVANRVAGIQARRAAQAEQQEQQAVAEQQKPRSEKIREILAQMQADYEAKVAAAKPPKATQEELDTEVAGWVDDEANAGKPLPAHLADLKAFQKYRTKTFKAEAPVPGKKPTYQDALAQVNQMEQEAKQQRRDELNQKFGRVSEEPGVDPLAAKEQRRAEYQAAVESGPQDLMGPRENPQTDMFGGGGVIEPVDVVEEIPEGDTSGQLTFDDYERQQKYDAAFNRADREQAKQRARDEDRAAQQTRPVNQRAAQAQAEVDANIVAAEVAPDLGLKKRQVRQLNKAQQAAAEAQAEADRQKETVRQTFVQEANAAIGPDETGNAQIPDNAVLNANNQLFTSNRGRPGRGMKWSRPVTNKDGKTLGYYKLPTETADETAAPEAQPETRDAAPQERVLSEAAPRTKTVKLTQRDADQIGGRSRGGKNDPLSSRHQFTEQLVGKTPEEIRSWIDEQSTPEAKRTGVEAHNRLVKRRGDSSGATRLVTQPDGEVMTEAEFVNRLKSAKKAEPQKDTDTKAKANAKMVEDVREAEQNADEPNDDYVRYDDLNDFGAGAGMDFDAGDVEFMATGKKKAKGVARAIAEPIIRKLQKEVGDRLGVKIEIYDDPTQAFGPNASVPDNAKGFYHSETNTVGVFVGAADSVRDLQETLDHELAGHFGLNTLRPDEKYSLLTDIARSLDNRFIKAAFDKVKREQTQIANNDLEVAEEVFARAAESMDKFWVKVFDAIVSKVAPKLREWGVLKGQMSMAEIREKAREVGKSIRDGSAAQQTFPRNSNVQFRGEALRDYVDDQLKPFGQNSADWAADAFKTFTTNLRSIPWLAKWKPEMKSLQQLHKAEIAMQSAYNQMADKAFVQVDDFKALPAPAQKALSKMMLDSTLARIHPGEAFGKGINDHLREDDRAKYDELQARWNEMVRAEPDTAKVYNNILKLFQDLRERRKTALTDLAKKVMSPREASRVKQAIDSLSTQMPGPYFPIGRFGDYVVTWKSSEYQKAQEDNDAKALEKLKQDPNHYRMRLAKYDTAGRRLLKEWKAELGDAYAKGAPEVKPRKEVADSVDVNLMPLLEKMKEAMDLTLEGKVGKKDMQEAKDALARTFIASLPDTNVFLSSLKRENVSGADAMDMLRGIASHGGSQAFYISRLEHSGNIQDALQALYQEDTDAMNQGEAVSIYRAVAKGLQGMYSQDPSTIGSKAIGTVMSWLYHGRLSLNPSFWAMSAMTPALVTMPYLTSRHKTTAAYSAWWQGMKDAAKVLKFSSMPEYLRFSFADQIKKSGLAEDEVKMLEALEAAGAIDQSQIRELANVARNDVGIGDDAMRFVAGLSHRAEVMSRISTALAAYRLEKTRTKDADAATQYALDAVDETLVNYTNAHTPLILRRVGPVGKALTQFMRYQFGMAQLMMFQFNKGYQAKDFNSASAKEARKRFNALMLAHALGTGGSGLFAVKTLTFVAQTAMMLAYPDDDEPDVEAKAREMMDEVLGKNLSVIARKGLPAAIGMDLSERMGMGGALSPRRDNPFAGNRQKMAENVANSIAPLGYMLDWFDWLKNPKASRVPVALAANVAKAYELGTSGMTNTHGVVKKGAEDFSGFDILLQAMGFTPTEKTEAFARQDADRRRKEAIGQGRQELLDQLYSAMRKGDKARIADLQAEIREFNSRHTGDKKAAITADTISKSFRQRKTREAEMDEYGIAP